MHAFDSMFSIATVFALVASISAAPVAVSINQIGSLACNTARLKTVTGLQATAAAVGHIPTASNATVAAAVSSAKAGIDASTAGVQTILNALFSGQGPPSDAHDQVGAGLTQTLLALQSVNSSNASTSKAVNKALKKLQKTVDAANDVVADCG